MILWILTLAILNSALAKRHAAADFESISKDPLYIDKTLLLARFLNLPLARKYQIMTFPPGFMKSTNLDMIKRFVQIEVNDQGVVKAKTQTRNFHLFNDAKFAIKTYEELYHTHLAAYPVIHFELSDVAGPTIPDILTKMSAKIRKCYRDYEWLYKMYHDKYPENYYPKNTSRQRAHRGFMSDIFLLDEMPATIIQNSINKLVEILHYYFNRRVIILIDDYDAPVIDTALNKDHHTALSLVKNVIDQIISPLLKPETKQYIEYMLILGTNSVPLSMEGNPVVVNPFLNNGQLSDHFVITEDELSDKLTQLKYDNSSHAEIKAKFGGYKTKERVPTFCKPDSIIRFLKNQSNDIPDDSWIDSGSLSALSVFLKNAKILARIEELLNGSDVMFQMDRPVDLHQYQKLDTIIRGLGDVNDFEADVFFTILLENGYLSYDLSEESYFAPFLAFKMPNEETREAFIKFYSPYKQ